MIANFRGVILILNTLGARREKGVVEFGLSRLPRDLRTATASYRILNTEY
jgi:hypothetical protein